MVVPTPRSKSTARGRAAGVYAAAPVTMPAPGSSEHEQVMFVLRQAILRAPGRIALPYLMAWPLWMALRDLLPSRSLKHFLRDNSDTFQIEKTDDGNWGFSFSTWSSAEPPRPPRPLRPAPVGAAGVSAAAPATALPAEEPPTATQRKVATEAATMDERAQAAQCPWRARPQPPVMRSRMAPDPCHSSRPAPAGAAGVSAAAPGPGFGTALQRFYDGSGMHTLSFPESSEGGGWGHSWWDQSESWGGWGHRGWGQGSAGWHGWDGPWSG